MDGWLLGLVDLHHLLWGCGWGLLLGSRLGLDLLLLVGEHLLRLLELLLILLVLLLWLLILL